MLKSSKIGNNKRGKKMNRGENNEKKEASQSALRRNTWSYIKTPKRSSQKQNLSISKSR